jgi:hypothetical protein
MRYWWILLIGAAVACTSTKYTTRELEESIVGTWTLVSDSAGNTLRLVRAASFSKNTRGYKFNADGSVIIYGPWGCQMPPNFRESPAVWSVDKKGRIVIEARSFIQGTAHWKIVSLKDDEMRYTTDLIL